MKKLLFEDWHIRAIISLIACGLVWAGLEYIALPAGNTPVLLVFCFAMLYFSIYIAARLTEPDWGDE